MWRGQRVSVVFPVFNEEAGIVQAIHDFQAAGCVDEIVAVDNNSTDRSVERIRTTSARLVAEPRQGYGHALRRGLGEATGELIILAEPDGTFRGRDVFNLLAYADDFDLVLGTRTQRDFIHPDANMGLWLRLGNRAVAQVLQRLFGAPALSDCGCTLRLVHAELARRILDHLTVGGSHFLPEMVILCLLAKARTVEVPVHYGPRLGTSKITGSFRGACRVGADMLRLVLRYRLQRALGRTPAFAEAAHDAPAPL